MMVMVLMTRTMKRRSCCYRYLSWWKLVCSCGILFATATATATTTTLAAATTTTTATATTMTTKRTSSSSSVGPSLIQKGLWLGGLEDAKTIMAQQNNNHYNNNNENHNAVNTPCIDCRFSFGGKFIDRPSWTIESRDRNVETLCYLAYLIAQQQQQSDSSNSSSNAPAILVHCRRGYNRGPATIAAYLMLYEGYSLEEALIRIQTARPQANTFTNTFLGELQQLERTILQQQEAKHHHRRPRRQH